jgi:hypothetical protein
MSKRENTAHFQAIRKELAEELGYDPDNLSTVESMRVDVVFGLKSSLDELRARMFDGQKVDTNEMRAIADTLERFLPVRPKPEPALDPRDDPHARLMKIVDNWIANHEAEKAARVEMGLPADVKDARIAQLEAEVARLGGEPTALPAPGERTITPSESDVMPPGEVPGRNLRTSKQVGPDDPKPPVTIDAKAESVERMPDGTPCPPGGRWCSVRQRVVPIPPQALSGDETRRRQDAVNARRDIDHQIMNAPSRVSGEPAPSLGQESWRFPSQPGHLWDGDKGREW